jgi:hypothetical protein
VTTDTTPGGVAGLFMAIGWLMVNAGLQANMAPQRFFDVPVID